MSSDRGPPTGPSYYPPPPGGGYASNPYGSSPPNSTGGAGPPGYYPPPPSGSSSGWLWPLLVGGVLLFLCCGGGVVGFAWFGLNIMGEEIANELRDNPKLREHIGELESAEMDIIASGAENDDDTFVYRVKGDKGSGRVTVRQITDENGDEVIEEATLRLPTGENVELVP